MKYVKYYESFSKKFYHVSNDPNLFFKKDSNNNYGGYLFFSSERQFFKKAKYLYEVKLNLETKDVFNIYSFLDNFEDSYIKNKDLIDKTLKDNLDYFYNAWIKSGVDSPEEVHYEWSENNKSKLNKFQTLLYFIRDWNDSWAIIETEIFRNLIEKLNYNSFTTYEEGIMCIATKDISKIEIINKKLNTI